MKITRTLVAGMLLLGSAANFSGCGMLKGGDFIEPRSYSLNAVKLIRPDITEGEDARTMRQDQYTVSAFSRLLLRFEEFLSKVDNISLGSGRRVYVYLSVQGSSDVNQAQTDLVLCPVVTNWMMLATWYKAHPMGSTGSWKVEGGDFATSGCIAASGHTDDTLQYDVTSWVTNYAIGRNQNYGLLLRSITSNSFGIYGDNDGAKSPRIEWMSY